jgi:peptide/nickel transport system substrate-binding protein
MSPIRYRTNLKQVQLKRRRLLACGAAAGAGMLAGCGSRNNRGASTSGGPAKQPAASGTPRMGGTLHTYIPVDPNTLDSQATKSIPANSVGGNVMSQLFHHQTGTDPKVTLAQTVENELGISMETPDAATWTVKLRTDAKFQNIPPVNGHAVQAEDVKASYLRALTIPDSAIKSTIPMVDQNQIETPAADTVVFKLKYPFGPFSQLLAGSESGARIYPRELLAGGYDPTKVVIGSGPFILDNYQPDVALTYKKNPDWFDKPRPYVDSQRTAIIADAAQQLAQFTAGNLDELNIDVNSLDTAKRANPNAVKVTTPYPNSYQLYGHMDDPASAFGDIRVRHALSLAIDREAIGKAVFDGQYQNNGVLASAKGKWALAPDQLGSGSQWFKYDPAQAKQLLAASGAADQLSKLLYPTKAYGPQFDTIAQMLNPMLTAVGFKTQLVGVDYASEFINVGKGILYGHYDRDALVFAIWMSGGDIPEYALFKALNPGGDTNHSKVNDPDLKQMVDKMIAIPDENQRLQAVYNIEKYVADKMYYIVGIPTGNLYTLVQPRVQNYCYSLQTPTDAGVETYAKLWLGT